MKMKQFLALTIAACFFGSEVSYARFSRSRARAQGQSDGASLTGSISGSAQSGQGTQNTQNTSIQQSSVDNINNSQKGKSTAYMIAGGLMIAAGYKFAACSGSFFVGFAACIAGAILVAMGLQSRRAGNSFNGPIDDSWRNICTYSANGCTGTMPNPYAPIVADNGSDEQIRRARNLAESKGIKIDPNTGMVTTSDGKKIDTSDPASITAAIGADNYKKLMDEVKKIEADSLRKLDQVKVSADTYGVGSGTAIALAEGGYDDTGADAAGGVALARTRKPAQVSGLTKNFNGDPIGVAGDSIFMMMSRRYKLKSNQNTFFGPELQ